MDTILRVSDRLYNTVSSLCVSPSLANIQGIVSSTYLFVLLINFQTSSKALEKFSLSMYSSTFTATSTAWFFSELSKSSSSLVGGAIIPSLYFSTIETVLETRLPKSFARSEFNLWRNFSLENDPSCPKENSLNRKYLKASIPYSSIMGSG